MINLFYNGGFYMWPLLLLALIILGLTIKKATDLFGVKQSNARTLESGLNAIFFWGAMSAVIGFLAHFHGMYEAMMAMSKAPDISPAIVAGGFAVSLITILFGLVIFLIASIAWLVLRWRYKAVVAAIN